MQPGLYCAARASSWRSNAAYCLSLALFRVLRLSIVPSEVPVSQRGGASTRLPPPDCTNTSMAPPPLVVMVPTLVLVLTATLPRSSRRMTADTDKHFRYSEGGGEDDVPILTVRHGAAR